MKTHELYLWTEGERMVVEVSAASRKDAKKKARDLYGDSAIIFYKGEKNYASKEEN